MEDQDDNWSCADPFYVSRPPGSVIEAKSGGFYTVVHHNLDGYGVIKGDVPEACADPDQSKWPKPTHMLREPYPSAEVPCIGEAHRLIRLGSYPEKVTT